MIALPNFPANEVLSEMSMFIIKGGAGKQNNDLGIHPALISQLQKKYANAASQSFVLVNRGIAFNVVLNSKTHTMTFTNPKGLSFSTKY